MKEISKKIIAIFVIMLMIINSSLLTIISVAAEDIKNVLDKSKAEVKNEINIEKYLQTGVIEQVICGGESGENARVCNYDWILNTRQQCIEYNINFYFNT